MKLVLLVSQYLTVTVRWRSKMATRQSLWDSYFDNVEHSIVLYVATF